jgi:tetratricopeptide (TPR) repeat protein
MKILVSILVCLISLQGYNQTVKPSGATDFFVSAAEKAKSNDYSGAVGDLAKVMSIDSMYVKAYFHWAEETYIKDETASERKTTVTVYQTLVIKVNHPKTEVSRTRKDSKTLYKEYKKALENYEKTWKLNPAGREVMQLNDRVSALYTRYNETVSVIKYLKREIELDISFPGLENINKLYYAHFNRMKNKSAYSNKTYSSSTMRVGYALPFGDAEEYTKMGHQLYFQLKSKELREALISDNDLFVSHLKMK